MLSTSPILAVARCGVEDFSVMSRVTMRAKRAKIDRIWKASRQVRMRTHASKRRDATLMCEEFQRRRVVCVNVETMEGSGSIILSDPASQDRGGWNHANQKA